MSVLGWLGTGRMGEAMATHLVEAGKPAPSQQAAPLAPSA